MTSRAESDLQEDAIFKSSYLASRKQATAGRAASLIFFFFLKKFGRSQAHRMALLTLLKRAIKVCSEGGTG